MRWWTPPCLGTDGGSGTKGVLEIVLVGPIEMLRCHISSLAYLCLSQARMAMIGTALTHIRKGLVVVWSRRLPAGVYLPVVDACVLVILSVQPLPALLG